MANVPLLRLLIAGLTLFGSLSLCMPTGISHGDNFAALSNRASALYNLWETITGNRKVIGDSARSFAIDQSSSNAWTVSYLYGCSALAITDREFVIMAHLQQEGGDCIQLGNAAAVNGFISNQLEPALDQFDPTAFSKVEFVYSSNGGSNAPVGVNTIESYIYDSWAGEKTFRELGGVIRRWAGISGGMGVPDPDSPAGLLVAQYVAGGDNPTGNIKVFYGSSPHQENPISEDAF